MSRATYQCTALMGTNKTGSLKADANGYYEVTLGALDFYNSAGAFYPAEPSRKMFEDSSQLQRRVRNGALRGEYGHPKLLPGMSKRDFLMRILDINEQSVSHHISEVWIDEDNVKDKSGKKVVAIVGRIRPSGPFGDALAKALENPKENVCFSVRSLTDDYVDKGGTVIKIYKEIVTWDYVNEPGISVANKFEFAALEALQSVGFDVKQLVLAKNMALSNGASMESNTVQALERVIKALGWTDRDERGSKRETGLMTPPAPMSQRW